MQNIESQPPLGGGGKLRHRAMPKMKDYCLRYYHCTPSDLVKIKKLPFAYLLSNVYAFSAKEIADFFLCSLSTAYRLVSDANFFYNRSKSMKAEVQRIADYILYIVKYKG